MKPVPAWVLRKVLSAPAITASSLLESARTMIPIGQTWPSPICGPPTPSAAVPRKNHGLSSLHTAAAVVRHSGLSGATQRR